MQTATPSTPIRHHLLTLLRGAALAAGIWLLGYAELAWLGFADAAIHAETRAGRRALARLSRRSTC